MKSQEVCFFLPLFLEKLREMDYNCAMEYRIIRSKRKTLCLTLDGDGVPVVRAPYRVSAETIEAFIKKHRVWLARRLSERTVLPSFTYGACVTLFGKEYVLAEGKPRIEGETVYLPRDSFRQAFVRLLKRLTAEYMSALTASFAEKYCFSYATVRVSLAHGRWGSCNAKGNISYSFRVAFLSTELCEYVAVHELCHTRQLNHSARFWREVAQILPDYACRRKELKQNAVVMQLLRN